MGFEPTTFCMAIRPVIGLYKQLTASIAGGFVAVLQMAAIGMRADMQRYAAIQALMRLSA